MLKTLMVAASKCRDCYITDEIQEVCNIHVGSFGFRWIHKWTGIIGTPRTQGTATDVALIQSPYLRTMLTFLEEPLQRQIGFCSHLLITAILKYYLNLLLLFELFMDCVSPAELLWGNRDVLPQASVTPTPTP